MVSAADRFAKCIAKDYALVMKEVRVLQSLTLPVPVSIVDIKPYTMMTIGLGKELRVADEKRIACSLFVEMTGRLITRIDDVIDVRNRSRPTNFSIASVLASISSLTTCCYFPLCDQIRRGCLTIENSLGIIGTYCRFAKSMFDGILWQEENGYFDPQLSPKSFAPVNTLLNEYVDRIAGDLFAWAIDALGYYEESLRPRISCLLAVARPFGRIFQINDDVVDLIEDLRAGQTTVVMSAIMHGGSPLERKNLVSLSKSPSAGKMDSERFAYLFPRTVETLTELKKIEYAKLCRGLAAGGVNVLPQEVRDIMENYEYIREVVLAKLWS